MLKRVATDVHPYEVEIGRFLSSEVLIADPTNRCVRTLDVFLILRKRMSSSSYYREYDSPRFATVGEAVACLQQLIEVRRIFVCPVSEACIEYFMY